MSHPLGRTIVLAKYVIQLVSVSASPMSDKEFFAIQFAALKFAAVATLLACGVSLLAQRQSEQAQHFQPQPTQVEAARY